MNINEKGIKWGQFFKALSDEQRLRILLLIFKQESGLCVCELSDTLLLPQYKVSRQLAVLRNAGFVDSEKNGLWVYYKISKNHSVLHAVITIIRKTSRPVDYAEDQERLEQRLKLREGGKCVVGFNSGKN